MHERLAVTELFGITRLGLGCMALSGLFGRVERRDAIRTIHCALELGVYHFDTAELYGPYVNEELLADALATQSNTATVATKVGYKIVDGAIVGLDSRPSSLRIAVEGSLRRLRRDCIDLVYQHRQDPMVPVEESVGELARLQSEGKIKGIGLSAVDSLTLCRARMVARIVAVQNEYSLLQREPERNLLETLERASTILVAYSPLARGLLGEAPRTWDQQASNDYRRKDHRFAPDRLRTIATATSALHEIAAIRQVPAPVVALAWLLGKYQNLAAIPGCRSPAQILTAIKAGQFELSAEENERLNQITPFVCVD